MVFTFQLLVSFTASMCSVFAGIYCVNREGEETREKHCRYGLTGMEMREARWKRGDIKSGNPCCHRTNTTCGCSVAVKSAAVA